MKTIALIIMVAIVLEALVEYIKTVMHMVEEKDYKTAITQAVTIALGVFLAFAFQLQLFNGAMSEIYPSLSLNPIIDMILTGILFSRGSNYFSDLVSKMQQKNTDALGQILALQEDGVDYIEEVSDAEDFMDDIEEEGDEDGIVDVSEA